MDDHPKMCQGFRIDDSYYSLMLNLIGTAEAI